MKGVFTLGIYIAIGITGAAFGQQPVPPAPPLTDAARPPAIDMLSRSGALTVTPERVVITYGAGGLLFEHNLKYMGYRNAGMAVEMRGPCYSACTLITAYVGKDKLCIGQGAFFAFHQVRTLYGKKVMPAETALMYWQQPIEIRDWIDRAGGHQNLPLDGFWTMYDHELWAIGYPRCTP